MMASRELSRWEKKRSARIGTVSTWACGLGWGRKIGACVRACGRPVRVCAVRARESAIWWVGLGFSRDGQAAANSSTRRLSSRRSRAGRQLVGKVRRDWAPSRRDGAEMGCMDNCEDQPMEGVHGPSHWPRPSAATKNCPSKAQNCLLSTEPPAKI